MNGIIDLTKYLREDPRFVDFSIYLGEYSIELIPNKTLRYNIDPKYFQTNVMNSIQRDRIKQLVQSIAL